MRTFGASLMGLGVVVGVGLAVALVAGPSVPWLASLPWLVTVGLAKLTFISALGLIAVGAVMRRVGRRAEERALRPDRPQV
jgi:hypothetical protein